MKNVETNQKLQNVTEVNGELADALVELGLAEYIIETGTEYDRASISETVLGYVVLGLGSKESEENEIFTITHNLYGWRVKRERYGVQRAVLGEFESPYGAVGIVRRHHPATSPLSGSTPTYPKWVFDEINSQLVELLEERTLIEHVVDVDIEMQEVVLSNDSRRTNLYLRKEDDAEWNLWLDHGCGFEILTTASLTEAVDRAQIELS
ncbi:hypothetical protein ACLI4Y_13145 [Natrialbaceae archaeon A-CW3]